MNIKRFIILICSFFLIGCGDIVLNKHSIASGNFLKPDLKTINTSGVLTKEHSKGWLYNSPSRRIVFTCTHSNPTVGTIVGFNDGKGGFLERKVIKTFTINVSMFRDEPLSKATNENLLNSDTTICVLDKAVPNTHKAYSLAHKTKDKDWVIAYHQDDTMSIAHLNTNENSAVVDRKSTDRLIMAGDSGLPWFNEKGEVLSHTTLIHQGFGPHYTHPLMAAALYKALEDAEDYTISN